VVQLQGLAAEAAEVVRQVLQVLEVQVAAEQETMLVDRVLAVEPVVLTQVLEAELVVKETDLLCTEEKEQVVLVLLL
jgi:hypothetical protein